MTGPTYDPGPLHEVASESTGQRWTLVFVRDLKHPVGKVWTVLSDPDHLRQWAPFFTDRSLDSTGAVTIIDNHTSDGPRTPGQVTRCEPPVLLEYTWESDVLRWDLEPTGPGTRLTLRHTLDERHMVPQVAAGWHICLNVAESVLDGEPMPLVLGDVAMAYGWKDLEGRYAEVLGVYQSPGE